MSIVRYRSLLGALGLLVAVLSPAAGCYVLVVDTDADQCETTAECDAKGPAFRGFACVDRVCVAPALAGQPCNFSFECRAPGEPTRGLACSDAGRCERPSGVACSSNLECIQANNNQPAICLRPEGVCQSLLSEDCRAVFPGVEALFDDDVLLLGTFLTALPGVESPPQEKAVRLAAEEIALNAGGVPGADGRKRPLALLACYSSTDALRAARHLVDRARVPAFVGPGLSGLTIEVANKLTVSSDVMLVSPSATSPALSALDDRGLVWRTCPSDVLQGEALSALAPLVETRARGAAADPTAPLRLAIVSRNDAYGQALVTALTQGLLFNGVGLAQAPNDANVYAASYATDGSDFANVSRAVAAHRPHVIMVIGTGNIIPSLLALDAQLADPKPLYLVADGLKVSDLIANVPAASDLPARLLGTSPGATGPAAQAFAQRYRQRYNDGTESTLGTTNAYDATYLLALAAAGLDAPTGPALRDRVGLMVRPGAPPDLVFNLQAPSQVDAFFSRVVAGQPFDLVGASGPLDFDTNVGEAPSTIGTWCLKNTSGTAVGIADTGLYYDPSTRSLVGANGCNQLAP
jgi:branched-chain amino acid transport system substrate-binding protein